MGRYFGERRLVLKVVALLHARDDFRAVRLEELADPSIHKDAVEVYAALKSRLRCSPVPTR